MQSAVLIPLMKVCTRNRYKFKGIAFGIYYQSLVVS